MDQRFSGRLRAVADAAARLGAMSERPAFAVELARQTEELRRSNLRLAVLRQRLAAPLLWEGDQA